ncbi:MAG: UbiA family prenyltransferase [Elusimicrobiota bacterium]
MPLRVVLGKIFAILSGIFIISAYALGSPAALLAGTQPAVFLKGGASLFLILCGGYLMNDLLDRGYDEVNRPGAGFAARLPRGPALAAAAALLAAGAGTAFFVNSWFAAVALPLTAALALYNLRSKRLGVFKAAAISLIVTSIYPLSLALTSGGAPSPRRDSLYVFPFWFFLEIMAYEIMRDVIDLPGDRAGGGSTLPMKTGPARARRLAAGLALAGVPVSLLPYLLGMCGPVYLAGALAAAACLLAGLRAPDAVFSKLIFANILLVAFSSLADLILG